MNYRVDHIPKNPKRRPGRTMEPKYLTIHSTGNPSSTAKNERAWLTNPSNTRTASWHIVVDQAEAIEAIPLGEVAYHAGTAKGNSTSIGIEICESGNREKTLQNAVELTANLLLKYGWGVDKLRRHHDWSGKICPRIMSANNWAGWIDFKNRVQRELEPKKEVRPVSDTPSKWAAEGWAWAVREGLIENKDPKEPITREQLAVILYRLEQK